MELPDCPFRKIEKAKRSFEIFEKINLIKSLKQCLDEHHREQSEKPAKKSRVASKCNSWHFREQLYKEWRAAIVDFWLENDRQRFAVRRFPVTSDNPLELNSKLK
jgi:hypothetical protein